PARTPANAELEDVIDFGATVAEADEAALFMANANLFRCVPGRGMQLWGGRTLDPLRRRFVAHSRLVHRMVRAFRRAAQPLVFEPNGRVVWYALQRTIVTVLLNAYRSGALRGAVPDEAFSVRCDETTTTVADIDAG